MGPFQGVDVIADEQRLIIEILWVSHGIIGNDLHPVPVLSFYISMSCFPRGHWVGRCISIDLTRLVKKGITYLLAYLDLIPEQAVDFDRTFLKGPKSVKELS